ncbi:MAG TPA: MFS transporter [Anaerovoracaceae bacterium]|nr:MFS transporter [Anaerovoracaceae bacterium]
MIEKTNPKAARIFSLLLIIIAASAVYELPYIRYYYYDVMMGALGVTHTQMGTMMSVYGIVAMICYFPGGWLADRFSCRKLLAFSLAGTGLGGLYFMTFPPYVLTLALHAFWGVTTSLTFWAAMIKATRMLGASKEQGKIFGILEGGRGLVPLLYSFPFLAVFNSFAVPELGFRALVSCYSIMTIAVSILIFFFYKPVGESNAQEEQTGAVVKDIIAVVKMPGVWILSLIIFSSYIMYTAQSYITPYLTEMFGQSDSSAAFIGLIRTYFIAIFAAPLAGIFADKIGSTARTLFYAFILILISTITFKLIPASPSYLWPVLIAMVLLAFSVFITRGIYFAAIDALKIPLAYTGAAVGLASFVGYIPETFIYNLIGSWLDNNTGVGGYQIMFTFLVIMAVVGLATSYILVRYVARRTTAQDVKRSN